MLNNKTANYTIKITSVFLLAIVAFFSISMNYDWRTGYVTWYGSLALVLAAYLIAYQGRMVIENVSFLLWLLAFIVLGIVSISWSLSASEAITIVKSFVVIFAVLLLIQCALTGGFDVNSLLRGYLVATLINAIYVVLRVDMAALGETQLGTELLEGWNSNGIGFMMAQGVLIGCHLIKQTERKLAKIFYLVSVLALSLLTVYTGSRTAFIMLLGELMLYYWLTHPTKVMRNILLSVALLAVAFFLIMNVKSFYNVLGVRLEGLLALFSGEGEVDSSANVRDTFIENGKRWFAEKPLLGYGLNNYKVLNQAATGRGTYAHNNFVEMAVNLGVVGLVWYYSVYVYLIVRLCKIIKHSPLNAFLLSALLASLVSHYGTVAYYDYYQNFLLLLCFFAVNKAKKEGVAIQS